MKGPVVSPQARARRKRFWVNSFAHVLLLVGCVVFGFPFYWLMSTSVKEQDELFADPPVWVPQWPARIDGAGSWRCFRHVTIPMLSPYIFFNLIMGIIGTLQIFTQAFIITQGGPVDSTLFYVYHLFNEAFRYFHMGTASAMAWILFIVILALTLIQLKLAPRWVHYEVEGQR